MIQSSTSFSVGTFNIQKPDPTWTSRREQVVNTISKANLDVVCLQELSDQPEDKKFLTEKFQKLGYALSAHTEKVGATALGIIWKTSRFDVVKTFTKNFEALDGGRVRKRCFSAVDLKDKLTGNIIRIASVHLYTEPREADQKYLGIGQLQSFRQQLEKESLEKGAVSRLIIAGDYNADFGRRQGDAVLNVLNKPQSGSEYLYKTVVNDNRGQKIVTKSRNKIDWIFAGAQGKVVPKMNFRPVENIQGASDHLMHAVDIHYDNEKFVEQQSANSVPVQPVNSTVSQKLQKCFSNRSRLVRRDLIQAGLVTKDNSNQMTKEWVRAGLLVQNGHGRDTYYTQGSKLHNVQNSQAHSVQPIVNFQQVANVHQNQSPVRVGLGRRVQHVNTDATANTYSNHTTMSKGAQVFLAFLATIFSFGFALLSEDIRLMWSGDLK